VLSHPCFIILVLRLRHLEYQNTFLIKEKQ